MNHPKLEIENELIAKGHKYICGVDESGVGAFAGGFTVGALILDLSKPYIEGIDDSKKLTKKKKRELEPLIKESCIDYSVVYVSAKEINEAYKEVQGQTGSFRKLHLNAMRQAVLNLKVKPDYVIVDGVYIVPNISIKQIAVIKGDQKSASVAGASILARVYRERVMEELATKYNGYTHWQETYGYCSTQEIVALNKLGVTPEHRTCFIEDTLNHKTGKIKEVNGKLIMKECPKSKGTGLCQCPCDYIKYAKEYQLEVGCPNGKQNTRI
jgi:ribonuclease HII